ncbi:MAG: aminoglycoside phosphotransferase family protein [Thermoguttaceae bacterium]
MIDHPANNDVAALLAQAGLPREFRLTNLRGGGNNRVYRIDCAGSSLLLKAYFHHADDPRDRLAAEFSFSRFAWDHRIRCLPQPLARDDRNHLGLYEFIRGRALEAAEIGPDAVDQAAAFFRALNQHKLDPAAQDLPLASEACFTLAEHLACVQRRIVRLVQLDDSSAIGREASAWIRDKLYPAWQRVVDSVLRLANTCGLAVNEPIPAADRCLSPSDFGFHTAIWAEDGRLRFIDFEYAGWDDPAKTFCDFFCQPEKSVPTEHLAGPVGSFTMTLIFGLSDVKMHAQRIVWLLDVYRLKWCCIMMNEFLPVAGQRRNFAQDAGGQEQRKRMQLEKAVRALQRVEAGQ